MNRKHTLGLVIRHELRTLIADRSLALVCALLVALIGYALYNGLTATDGHDHAISTVLASEKRATEANIETLRRIEAGQQTPGPFANPANPGTIGNGGAGRYAVVPSTALSPIAIGQSDMIPNYYSIGYRSKVSFMYDSEIENPWNLLNGHFDLAFLIVFLLPIMVFSLSYNLLSSEREAGTLRMLMSQPLTLVTLLTGKIAVRATIVIGIAAILPVVLLMAFRPEIRDAGQIAALSLWIGLAAAYGLFWFALAFVVNALGRSSAFNALALIAIWTMIVLVLPVVLNLLVGLAQPAPSRTELTSRTRAIQADNLRRYDKLFHGDYNYLAKPDALLAKDGRIEMPPRTRATFLADRDMDARIDALLKRFDGQIRAQQRLIDRLGPVSPAVIAYEGFSSLAGNGSRRYLAFKDQVDTFHDQWRTYFVPRILGGRAMSEDELRNLPRWNWRELPAAEIRGDAIWRVGLLMSLAVLLFILGLVTLRRYTIA
jgi:ABC-2 type transport system permease protein